MPTVSTEVQTDESELKFLLSEDLLDEMDLVHSGTRILKHSGIFKRRSSRRFSFQKCLCILLFLTVFSVVVVIYFGSLCPELLCIFDSKDTRLVASKNQINSFLLQSDKLGMPVSSLVTDSASPSFDEVIGSDFQFDITGHDVIVFLHIQKTGGSSFGRHLVKDLDLKRECVCHRKHKKRCTCLRPNSDETWIFSRYTTGWKCGLHADWTELTSCVDKMMNNIDNIQIKRRYFYVTFLRDPIARYLSEFRHVQRGATWKSALLFCQGRPASKEEVPSCFSGESWENVTFDDFALCENNLAHNRQTRMLADLELVGCYNKSVLPTKERESTMLLSAKNNLKKMAFFGLTEEQEKSQYLFETTFNLKFNVRFMQHENTQASDAINSLDPKLIQLAVERNRLDLELYSYAKELLEKRFSALAGQDGHFQEHFKSMGGHRNFSWKSIEN